MDINQIVERLRAERNKLEAAIQALEGVGVKGGVKTDHWGGVKVDQWVGRRSGIVGEEGVWSGGLRRLKGGAFRPERKTSSSPRRVRRSGWWIRSFAASLACVCSA